ncbi:hypothetical protein [Leadbettera azotonutricia]|uniref:Uncharacterized protein n=1 Tax=Leadbettera azotonutricia (strain ATCC BAA-888 / DSM 13862 / ZAS-9) TaxID=545695 RepID=F5Y9Q9_LEAAZ|nr:hypothetical protein [Leadbettera azotonutricia]AEF80493.1 hypothetical protein TREAZ_3211 [Leadbettera azotonutricia ZAS-9]
MGNHLFLKGFRMAAAASLILALTACNGPLKAEYSVALPQLPQAWAEIIGSPHWLLQWVNEDGAWESRRLPPYSGASPISPLEEWAVPVLAWPYWPGKDLAPGCMRPAGAIYPWDASGGSIAVSWQGGVDAYFWQELASCGLPELLKTAGTPRLPWLFDWPRFRELLQSPEVPDLIRDDPWTADWSSIAKKTLASGFDKRRIVPRPRAEILVPGLGVPWIGASPFAVSLSAAPGEALHLPVSDEAEAWVSVMGTIKGNKDAWIFVP